MAAPWPTSTVSTVNLSFRTVRTGRDQAARNPADTSYYYYALGDDNTHHFFRTYSEMQSFMASQERYSNS